MPDRFLTALIVVLVVLPGCVISENPQIPLASKFYDLCESTCENLVVFLPGRGDKLDAFERAGFTDLLAESGLEADAVAIGAHLGYYRSGTLTARIYEDILLPYGRNGYRRFFLVGVSLGGYGALWVNAEHAPLVSGMVLLAPYLGDKGVVTEIDKAGDISSWRNSLGREPDKDDFAWIWLDDLVDPQENQIPNTVLAYGRSDKFSKAAEIAANRLPPNAVISTNGAHNWATWTSLWRAVLEGTAWETMTMAAPGRTAGSE